MTIELQQRILAAHERVVVAESEIQAYAPDADLSPGQTDQLEALVCEWEQLGQALTTWVAGAFHADAPSEPEAEPASTDEYVEPENPKEVTTVQPAASGDSEAKE